MPCTLAAAELAERLGYASGARCWCIPSAPSVSWSVYSPCGRAVGFTGVCLPWFKQHPNKTSAIPRQTSAWRCNHGISRHRLERGCARWQTNRLYLRPPSYHAATHYYKICHVNLSHTLVSFGRGRRWFAPCNTPASGSI